MKLSVKQFIQNCQVSSSQAYDAFKTLLAQLDCKETRENAVRYLHQITDYFEQNRPENCHFQFLKQPILNYQDESQSLKLLQFPSTFLPEAWSFTFYEGLIRYPANEYQDKMVVELGCGIGWISIALALRYQSRKIVGVDINPKAITCARLNLYLNSFTSDGNEILLEDQSSLLEKVEFFESNLFSHFDGQKIEIDRIVGCIPQVLNPQPEIMENLIAETASDEYLFSLSNYFAKQGFIEDQFGLGLIASAVEQSIPLLKASGKLTLNLGGRPGRAVLERLMRRRGFDVRRIWQTQVEQAADTEIDALVDIEKNTGHRFEFYLSPNSDVTVDARTAQMYANSGGKIYHSVDVYEAEMMFPDKVKTIFRALEDIGDRSIRSALDLTFDNYNDAEERYSFLAFLARQLQNFTNYPYKKAIGHHYFRQQLSEFFSYYLKVELSESAFLITPGRRELITSLLANYQPACTLVAKQLGHLVEKQFDTEQAQIIESPTRIEFLLELINRLKPQLVITQLEEFEVQSSQLVAQLVECAQKNQVLLVIDLTENMDLSSQPAFHGVYRYLSENQLPQNVILMAGLTKNSVYQNYALNITVCNNPEIITDLTDAANLTYSRTPLLKQLYYGHLLEELLFFQRTRFTSLAKNSESTSAPSLTLTLSENAQKAFDHPAIRGNHLDFDEKSIRLDFGENELAAPEILKEVLLESYLVRKCVGEEGNPETAVLEQLYRRFNLPVHYAANLTFGNGVAPIYSALLDICKEENQKLIIPAGSYGYFVAAANYKGVAVEILSTESEDHFKINPQRLKESLAAKPGSWVLINAPIVNPTGAIYSEDELSELLTIAEQNKATIIVDSIFSGLEYGDTERCDLANAADQILRNNHSRLILMGGISKEYAAGGLRFGYCWSTSPILNESLNNALVHQPHFTIGYAVRKLFEAHLNGETGLRAHLRQQKNVLKDRAKRLTEVLETQGWQVIPPEGGLFMVAKPEKLIQAKDLDPTDAGDQITERLFEQQNIVINNSTWTGLPGYCRFVLSSSEQDFENALSRLAKFELVL